MFPSKTLKLAIVYSKPYVILYLNGIRIRKIQNILKSIDTIIINGDPHSKVIYKTLELYSPTTNNKNMDHLLYQANIFDASIDFINENAMLVYTISGGVIALLCFILLLCVYCCCRIRRRSRRRGLSNDKKPNKDKSNVSVSPNNKDDEQQIVKIMDSDDEHNLTGNDNSVEHKEDRKIPTKLDSLKITTSPLYQGPTFTPSHNSSGNPSSLQVHANTLMNDEGILGGTPHDNPLILNPSGDDMKKYVNKGGYNIPNGPGKKRKKKRKKKNISELEAKNDDVFNAPFNPQFVAMFNHQYNSAHEPDDNKIDNSLNDTMNSNHRFVGMFHNQYNSMHDNNNNIDDDGSDNEIKKSDTDYLNDIVNEHETKERSNKLNVQKRIIAQDNAFENTLHSINTSANDLESEILRELQNDVSSNSNALNSDDKNYIKTIENEMNNQIRKKSQKILNVQQKLSKKDQEFKIMLQNDTNSLENQILESMKKDNLYHLNASTNLDDNDKQYLKYILDKPSNSQRFYQHTSPTNKNNNNNSSYTINRTNRTDTLMFNAMLVKGSHQNLRLEDQLFDSITSTDSNKL